MSATDDLRNAVIDGQARDAVSHTQHALEEGISADELLQDGLMAAMREVGRLFEENEIYVPEMLVSAHAMKSSLEVLRPHLVRQEVKASGRIAIGTVEGDLHDIGKNLVAMMLQGAGFEVEDLGNDVYPQRFVEAAQRGADVIAISALLTTTMTNMPSVIDAIRAAGLRDRVRIVIGGAPITQEYCDAIGADGYAKTAASAVGMVQDVLGLAASTDGRAATAR
ncbi:MAG TPA: corrinoid protein [Solirubrobacteraceae bacterium]|nr:corrinoid protein [Solirubrobacteraceae bacterium]